MSAFKTGNVVAFKLAANVDFSLPTSKGSSLKPCTLLVPSTLRDYRLITMAVQTVSSYLLVTLQPLQLLARKQSLVFWSTNGANYGQAFDSLSSFLMALISWTPFNHSWFSSLLYVGGGIPMNAWLMKGWQYRCLFGWISKLDGMTPVGQIVLLFVRPAVQALWAFMDPRLYPL